MQKFKYAKLLALGSLFLAFATFAQASELGSDEIYKQPHHHVFFDLHGVIYKKSVPGIIKVVAHNIFWKYPNKWDLWKNLAKASLNPFKLYQNVKWARSYSKVADTVFDKLFERYSGLKKHDQLFRDIATDIQHPIPETSAAIKALHDSPNATCYLLSNIGVKSLGRIRQKHPNLWKNFMINNPLIPNDRLICGDWPFGKDDNKRDYCKPRPEAFTKTLEKFELENKENNRVWFVDDRIKNTDVANKNGFKPMHFTKGAKFLEDLVSNEILTWNEIDNAKQSVHPVYGLEEVPRTATLPA